MDNNASYSGGFGGQTFSNGGAWQDGYRPGQPNNYHGQPGQGNACYGQYYNSQAPGGQSNNYVAYPNSQFQNGYQNAPQNYPPQPQPGYGPLPSKPSNCHGGYSDNMSEGYPPPQGPPPSYYQNQVQPQGPNPHAIYGPNGQLPPLSFPPEFTVWKKTNASDLTESFCLGIDTNQEPMFSAKRPTASGKIVLRYGGPKDKGSEVVRTEGSGYSSNQTVKFPDGSTVEVKKRNGRFAFTMNINEYPQNFEWREADDGSSGLAKLLSTGPKNYELVREGDSSTLVEFTSEKSSALSLSSKSPVGNFLFLREAASGALGPAFAATAIVSLLKVKQAKMEEKEVKMALKMLGGISHLH